MTKTEARIFLYLSLRGNIPSLLPYSVSQKQVTRSSQHKRVRRIQWTGYHWGLLQKLPTILLLNQSYIPGHLDCFQSHHIPTTSHCFSHAYPIPQTSKNSSSKATLSSSTDSGEIHFSPTSSSGILINNVFFILLQVFQTKEILVTYPLINSQVQNWYSVHTIQEMKDNVLNRKSGKENKQVKNRNDRLRYENIK